MADSGGGGGIIIGDQPVSYWLEGFGMRLNTEAKRDRCAALVQKYNAGSYNLTPDETQFLLDCMKEIAASLDRT